MATGGEDKTKAASRGKSGRGLMRITLKRFGLLVVVALVSAMCMTSTADASAPLGVTITLISPNPFTPNGDHHADKTNIYVRIATT
jgi:hypothetical protein